MTNSQDINNRLKKVLEDMRQVGKRDETKPVVIDQNKLPSSKVKSLKKETNTDK
jgi:hypothetical protein